MARVLGTFVQEWGALRAIHRKRLSEYELPFRPPLLQVASAVDMLESTRSVHQRILAARATRERSAERGALASAVGVEVIDSASRARARGLSATRVSSDNAELRAPPVLLGVLWKDSGRGHGEGVVQQAFADGGNGRPHCICCGIEYEEHSASSLRTVMAPVSETERRLSGGSADLTLEDLLEPGVGRALPRREGELVERRLRTSFNAFFCSGTCIQDFGVRLPNALLRQLLLKIEGGVCQREGCGVDTRDLGRTLRALRPGDERRAYLASVGWTFDMSDKVEQRLLARLTEQDSVKDGALWQADHIDAVFRGGGQCSLSNMRTLCTRCHLRVTRYQATERALMRADRKRKEAQAQEHPDAGEAPPLPPAAASPALATREAGDDHVSASEDEDEGEGEGALPPAAACVSIDSMSNASVPPDTPEASPQSPSHLGGGEDDDALALDAKSKSESESEAESESDDNVAVM